MVNFPFLGSFVRKVDAKLRVCIPLGWVQAAQETYGSSRVWFGKDDPENQLYRVFPEDVYCRMLDTYLAEVKPGNAAEHELRDLQRGTEKLHMDGQHRVTPGASLEGRLGQQREVTLIGAGEYFIIEPVAPEYDRQSE